VHVEAIVGVVNGVETRLRLKADHAEEALQAHPGTRRRHQAGEGGGRLDRIGGYGVDHGHLVELVGCAVNTTTGTIVPKVERPLAAADAAQDQTFVNGTNVFLYAYGDGFGDHGSRRRSVEVDLSATGALTLAGERTASPQGADRQTRMGSPC